MQWDFQEGIPIYSQIVDEILTRIARQDYSPGDRLPSVRELALEAGVNPNTMQRAYADLEQQGYVHAERTSGRFVTADKDLLRLLKDKLSTKAMEECIAKLQKLGLAREEIRETLSHWAGHLPEAPRPTGMERTKED